jgi:hypothetical protein
VAALECMRMHEPYFYHDGHKTRAKVTSICLAIVMKNDDASLEYVGYIFQCTDPLI